MKSVHRTTALRDRRVNKTTGGNNIPKKNNLLLDKYDVGKLLGHGAFAKVYHARNVETGESVAIKAVSKNRIIHSGHVENIKREISVLRRVRHPNVIRLREVLATKGKIFFVMDFARGGELMTHVKRGGRFGESLCRRYFRQLISAVRHCHSLGVFHRDIKPENLLLDAAWNLKVSDFGLSAFVDDGAKKNKVLQTVCGTPAYVAPEILLRKGYEGAATDVWSCGVVLFVLAAGYLPFNDASMISMYRSITRGEFKCPTWFSPDLQHLISRMLDTNPETRITIKEIYNDPWFTKESVSGYDSDQEQTESGLQSSVGDEDEEVTVVTSEPEPGRCVNAFDIIAHSASFDLSGLFINSGAGEDASVVEADQDLTGQKAEKIIEFVKKAAEEAEEVAEVVPKN